MAIDRAALRARLRATFDRRRLARVGVWVAVLGVLVVTVVLNDDGTGSRIRVAADETTTTTTEPSVAIDAAIDFDKVEPALETPAASVAPAPTTTAAPRATAPHATTAGESVVECLNSHDERCGDFWWTSEPSNEPLVLSVTPSATEVAVGQELVLHVVASDADARPYSGCLNRIAWGDGGVDPQCAYTECVAEARFGPWDPPAPQPGVVEFERRHTFTQAGVMTVEVTGGSQMHYCPGIYNSHATQTLTVTVVEPPSS